MKSDESRGREARGEVASVSEMRERERRGSALTNPFLIGRARRVFVSYNGKECSVRGRTGHGYLLRHDTAGAQ